MVAGEAFDGEPVLFIVFLVKHCGIIGVEREVFDEELV